MSQTFSLMGNIYTVRNHKIFIDFLMTCFVSHYVCHGILEKWKDKVNLDNL